MLSFSTKQRYFIYSQPCDMRKGFNGLGGLVNSSIGHPLMSGDVFIFINRRRTHIKLLMWDATGFAIYYKRLETGTFEIDFEKSAENIKGIEIKWSDLVLLLEGITMNQIKKRKRFVTKVIKNEKK